MCQKYLSLYQFLILLWQAYESLNETRWFYINKMVSCRKYTRFVVSKMFDFVLIYHFVMTSIWKFIWNTMIFILAKWLYYISKIMISRVNLISNQACRFEIIWRNKNSWDFEITHKKTRSRHQEPIYARFFATRLSTDRRRRIRSVVMCTAPNPMG